MKSFKHSKESHKRFPYSLSIQQRLPLLMCVLLIIVVILFSATSYIAMRNTSLNLGRERLNALSQQLSSLFEQSTRSIATATRNSAKEEAISNFILSEGTKNRQDAIRILNKLREDTLTHLVELTDAGGQKMLSSGLDNLTFQVNLDSAFSRAKNETGVTYVGKIYPIGDSMYFPIVSAVLEHKNAIGFIIRWRLVTTTAKALDQFTQLLGTNARLNIGNRDGQFWTDLLRPVPAPPMSSLDFNNAVTYKRNNGDIVLAAVKPIPQTEWLLLIEFSNNAVLAGAKNFIYWILGMGILLIIVGSALAWRISRNITHPLNKLTSAATSISNGDYKVEVAVNRRDELGELARAFQAMSVQVQNSQILLEKKVKDRTVQLETANKELEAFSYSVSHDLRAPLRAVSGYGMILKEDYEKKLDSEGKRVIDAIISNARMMGILIDDLITFSRISRKEMIYQHLDMKTIVDSCLSELLESDGITKYKVKVDNLPPASGDKSMIKQVWLNLISNAVKYSSNKAHPCIEIGFREEEYTNIYFIRDNGVGFDMKYAHKLFGVFQRLHSAENFEGTGIGLALVHRIVSKHGGEIWAQSELDQGATFFFRLFKINKSENE